MLLLFQRQLGLQLVILVETVLVSPNCVQDFVIVRGANNTGKEIVRALALHKDQVKRMSHMQASVGCALPMFIVSKTLIIIYGIHLTRFLAPDFLLAAKLAEVHVIYIVYGECSCSDHTRTLVNQPLTSSC